MTSSAAAAWPKALTNFVERVFARAVTDKDRAVAEKYVEALILRASKQNAINTTDWDQAPLPSLSFVASSRQEPAPPPQQQQQAFPTTTFGL